jgi:outer membrane protein assembly factor BamB
MNARTGRVRWRLNVPATFKGGTGQFGFIESLLIDGPRVICTAGSADALLVALDKRTGEMVWKTAAPGLKDKAAYCSGLLIGRGGRRLVVTMTSHHIIGVDAADGRLLWKYPHANPYGQNPNTPIHMGGMVFCTSGDKVGSVMLKLSADGGAAALQWRQPVLDCHHGNVIASDGYLYASAHQNSKGWVCLDARTGAVMYTSRAVATGSACYADGMLYCYGIDGSVALVRPSAKRLEIVSRFDLPAGAGRHFAHPVICGGRLYIRHGERLYVYDVTAGGR